MDGMASILGGADSIVETTILSIEVFLVAKTFVLFEA